MRKLPTSLEPGTVSYFIEVRNLVGVQKGITTMKYE